MFSLFLRIYADVILVIVNATLWKLNPFKMREITLPAKMRHHALPAIVKPRLQTERLSGHRMLETQLARMQHQTRAREMLRHGAILTQVTVFSVTNNRVT